MSYLSPGSPVVPLQLFEHLRRPSLESTRPSPAWPWTSRGFLKPRTLFGSRCITTPSVRAKQPTVQETGKVLSAGHQQAGYQTATPSRKTGA